jgi:hypothetical protein
MWCYLEHQKHCQVKYPGNGSKFSLWIPGGKQFQVLEEAKSTPDRFFSLFFPPIKHPNPNSATPTLHLSHLSSRLAFHTVSPEP